MPARVPGQEHPVDMHDVADDTEARQRCPPARRSGRPQGRARRTPPSRPRGSAGASRPSVFRMTASWMRRRWPAATAPTSTSAPATRVSDPVAVSAAATWSEQRGHRGQHVFHADAGDVRQRVGHDAEQPALVRPSDADGGDVRVRRVLQQAGARHHGEVQRQALPGDVAQAGDLQVDVAPEHVDPDDVADADAPAARKVGVERHQRWAVVVGWPPVPGDDARARAAAWRHRSGRGRLAAPIACRASPAPGPPARRSPRRCGPAGWEPGCMS